MNGTNYKVRNFSFVTHVSLGVVQLGISCIKYILGY